MIELVKDNDNLVDMISHAKAVIQTHENICVSVSGGKDSDVMVDLFSRLSDKKIHYVWFNTGLEYQATKNHLDYLEQKYGITIERERAIKPIPLSCKEYGQPFISKIVSQMIFALQKNGFQWEGEPYEELLKKYPNCKYALKWWTDKYTKDGFTTPSTFSVERNKYLKEFMIQNPPTFKISDKCCKYAKKEVSKKYIKDNKIDCQCVGVRRAEGGIRSVGKTCFTRGEKSDVFRPLFWLTNEDEQEYCEIFDVTHSDCYEVWGFERTGCVGCPYNRNILNEAETIKRYEPLMYKAVNNVFKESYEYTRQYNEYVKKRKAEDKIKKQLDKYGLEQRTIYDFLDE